MPHHTEPFVLIVGGVHGAGKSTLCQRLAENHPHPIRSPQLLEAELNHLELSRADTLRELRDRVAKDLSSGRSFYFEHVMSGHYIDRLLDQIKAANFQSHLIYLNVDTTETAFQRVSHRVANDGHDVERELIESRLPESRRQFWHTYRRLADTWRLFDASTDALRLTAYGTATVTNVAHEPTYQDFTTTCSRT